MKQDATMKMKATAEHFSQANPAGPGQDDIPSLLRRVAESVEAIGPVEVQDLILHTEMTDNGPWYSLTVYFQRLSDARAESKAAQDVALAAKAARPLAATLVSASGRKLPASLRAGKGTLLNVGLLEKE